MSLKECLEAQWFSADSEVFRVTQTTLEVVPGMGSLQRKPWTQQFNLDRIMVLIGEFISEKERLKTDCINRLRGQKEMEKASRCNVPRTKLASDAQNGSSNVIGKPRILFLFTKLSLSNHRQQKALAMEGLYCQSDLGDQF